MHDFHIHTNLSRCAVGEATLENYLNVFPVLGLTEVCFTDHLWDRAVPGPSRWYEPQDVERLLPFRETLERTRSEVALHFGCETELDMHGHVALREENASLFDFILVPHNHLHMSGFTRPADLTDSREVASLLVRRFLQCCDNVPFAFSFAHPFTPLGYIPQAEEILGLISDADFERCFSRAAERNASVEFNISILSAAMKEADAPAVLAHYRRMYRIALGCGCRFHLGSDSHATDRYPLADYRAVIAFAAECGIRLDKSPLPEKNA